MVEILKAELLMRFVFRKLDVQQFKRVLLIAQNEIIYSIQF